ncbi:hypothetical protein [Paraburkholderia diazotrophica]|uniref:hypothetical protein n=1 Tax=Paraburkholderia diazotrophica TaxID=667676 RepID=UPI0031781180
MPIRQTRAETRPGDRQGVGVSGDGQQTEGGSRIAGITGIDLTVCGPSAFNIRIAMKAFAMTNKGKRKGKSGIVRAGSISLNAKNGIAGMCSNRYIRRHCAGWRARRHAGRRAVARDGQRTGSNNRRREDPSQCQADCRPDQDFLSENRKKSSSGSSRCQPFGQIAVVRL